MVERDAGEKLPGCVDVGFIPVVGVGHALFCHPTKMSVFVVGGPRRMGCVLKWRAEGRVGVILSGWTGGLYVSMSWQVTGLPFASGQ